MKEEIAKAILDYKLQNNLKEIKDELVLSMTTPDVQKDIVLVVKDQLQYVSNCINSLYEYSGNFNLYIWDNGSGQETKDYLNQLNKEKNNVYVHRSETNEGFIIPNNEMTAKGNSPYIVILNTDTQVKTGWDKLLIGFLQTHPDVWAVGYAGSQLNEEFKGGPAHFGYDVDYIPGWCICLSRETYNRFGLFDAENLNFIYGEDADFSLRLKESGGRVYALYTDLVIHFENKTVLEVNKDDSFRRKFSESFHRNHEYLRRRYGGKGLLLRESVNDTIHEIPSN